MESLPCVGDWHNSITVAEDILKFLVVSLKFLDPFDLPFRKTDPDTVQVPGPRPPSFRVYPLYLHDSDRQPDRLLALSHQ